MTHDEQEPGLRDHEWCVPHDHVQSVEEERLARARADAKRLADALRNCLAGWKTGDVRAALALHDEQESGTCLKECDCIIPDHWPKNVVWSHRDGCAKKSRLIQQEKERWCSQ